MASHWLPDFCRMSRPVPRRNGSGFSISGFVLDMLAFVQSFPESSPASSIIIESLPEVCEKAIQKKPIATQDQKEPTASSTRREGKKPLPSTKQSKAKPDLASLSLLSRIARHSSSTSTFIPFYYCSLLFLLISVPSSLCSSFFCLSRGFVLITKFRFSFSFIISMDPCIKQIHKSLSLSLSLSLTDAGDLFFAESIHMGKLERERERKKR